MCQSLTQTVPASSSPATSSARWLSVLQTPADSPYSVSLAIWIGLVGALGADHREDRAENLLARDRHVVADVGEDRRLDPETALELRATGLTPP